jgi:hypothetical protein
VRIAKGILMAEKSRSGAGARHARKLRLLEADLAKATERFRVAKIAAKEAKADAKLAKKEMKRHRKALVAAQEQEESQEASQEKNKAAPKAAVKPKSPSVDSAAAGTKRKAAAPSKKRRIAESPETVRKQRPARRSVTSRKKQPVATESSPPIDNPDLQPQPEPIAPALDETNPLKTN